MILILISIVWWHGLMYASSLAFINKQPGTLNLMIHNLWQKCI
jgi:hypothetical protein